MPFTVACAQIAPQKAEVQANLDKIAECIRQAATEGADLVVFPETSTSGYFLEGGVLESSLTEEQLCEELQRRVGGLDRQIDAVVGFYEQRDGNLYNAAAYIEFNPQAVVRKTYRKFFLPTYGLFDEERFVSRGRDLAVFDTRFGKLAILICEDAWHSVLPTLCAMKGAQMIIVPAASPGRGFSSEQVENLDRYARLMKAIAEEHGIYCVNCQLCGFEGGKGFVGGSMVIDPFGKLIAQGPVNEEHILLAQIDLDLIQVARAQTPLISDLQSAWGDIRRIVDEE
jgi:N-carbamoylputrescine amidase